MLTTNLQYVLIDGEQKRNMEDMRIERSANLLAIEVLQAGLSPIEERLAAELRVSNDLAACLRRQLTDIAASQDGKIDLETLSAQQTGACKSCVQLLTKVKRQALRDQHDDGPRGIGFEPRKKLGQTVRRGCQ